MMPLPPGKTAWDVLEEDFLQLFVNCAEHERACDEMKQLSMASHRIGEYVLSFLTRRAWIKLDDPANMRTFACWVPSKARRKMHR